MVLTLRCSHRLFIMVLRQNTTAESGSCTGVLYTIVGAIERDDMRQCQNACLPDRT